MAAKRILILGGTTEARQLAGLLAGRSDLAISLSLAGRTESPVKQPVPVRTGGFGGAAGLADHLRAEKINLLIDATHPYAARISANAAVASRNAGVPILALRRPAWTAQPGDDWTDVDDTQAAVEALGAAPRRAFLALGRNEVAAFEAAPQHFYLIRSVDPVEPPLAVPNASYVLGRGPFSEEGDLALLGHHHIEAIVCKNSGGSAASGKLAAARRLGIPVFLIRRPRPPGVPGADSVGGLLALIDQRWPPVEKRGE